MPRNPLGKLGEQGVNQTTHIDARQQNRQQFLLPSYLISLQLLGRAGDTTAPHGGAIGSLDVGHYGKRRLVRREDGSPAVVQAQGHERILAPDIIAKRRLGLN